MDWKKWLWKSLSYVLVAATAAAVTMALQLPQNNKLAELERLVDKRFIGETDLEKARDAAADAFVEALGDRWSYYIPAESFAAHQENKQNAYVGIGITITVREDGTGEDIIEVAPGSSAQEAGILPGDTLIKVNGDSIAGMDQDQVSALVRGEEGTSLTVTVLRDGIEKEFSLKRQTIRVVVAAGQMLDGKIGLVQINNFNTNCASETIAVIKDLQAQGVQKLIFDVRNNPGGYVNEMLKVLDHLLPECVLYRDLDYLGNRGESRSDADCVEMPMAVLVNGNSYSAAEFFAAVLQEYEWAVLVGEKTCGKGYYQNTFSLSDGSAVNLSTGKYFTPKGVNLTDVGGLTLDVPVAVDAETAAMIYAGAVPPAEDPQIQAAVAALSGK